MNVQLFKINIPISLKLLYSLKWWYNVIEVSTVVLECKKKLNHTLSLFKHTGVIGSIRLIWYMNNINHMLVV